MANDRPTFSESWYRVANLKPRLRSMVHIHRQQFRGQLWYVVQDPTNNQFFRLNPSAHRFLGLLNGQRSVAEVWDICNHQLGDHAPTQGEVIQLLGQLYVSNLLMAEVPPDACTLFERYRKRKRREVQGTLQNLMFLRIPLFDPDHLLNRFAPAVSWIFSWVGVVLWSILLGGGGYFAIQNASRLAGKAQGVLNTDNLPLLYLSFALIKLFHEFGHAFACKILGQREGTGGEVHVMGIMFMVMTPMPYVDASSAWALRSKWRRAIIGAAGMWVELALAAGALLLWAHTATGTVLSALCYNVMFVASVSTLLFNANPLLRYDGYYIFSDLIEIPNLSQRGKEYIYYLVRRYAWSVRGLRSPAHSRSERKWLLTYGIASSIYRVVICVSILLFVSSKFFVFGMLMALGALIAWGVVPLVKFLRYLLTSSELSRTRGRALASTGVLLVGLVAGVAMFQLPDHVRVEGIVEQNNLHFVYATESGFVSDFSDSGQVINRDGRPLVMLENAELTSRLQTLLAERRELIVQQRIAQSPPEIDYAAVQSYAEQLSAKADQIDHIRQRISRLAVHAPVSGLWLAPDIDQRRGDYVEQSETLGLISPPGELCIRATATQQAASALLDEIQRERISPLIEIRVRGRPDMALTGTVEKIFPAGQVDLPHDALSLTAGGTIETSPQQNGRAKAKEHLFELRIRPDPDSPVRLLAGQRVALRFSLEKKSLARQWYMSLRRLFQKRFQM